MTLEFYWGDLTKKKQQEILDIFGENCNWDVFPFCEMEIETEDKSYIEFCVMDSTGDNIECFQTEQEALDFCKGTDYYILLVYYDKFGNEVATERIN